MSHSFYRFVLEPELAFTESGSILSSYGARFSDMPQKPVLTVGMDPPESWLIESVRAHYDLDNLYLGEVINRDLYLGYISL